MRTKDLVVGADYWCVAPDRFDTEWRLIRVRDVNVPRQRSSNTYWKPRQKPLTDGVRVECLSGPYAGRVEVIRPAQIKSAVTPHPGGPMLIVTNDEGHRFNVRVVCKGGRYGRNDVLTHEDARPMIEFYDATYENEPGFADFMGRGQFVSRYFLFSLEEHRDDYRAGRQGLNLEGGVPVWRVTGENVADAIDYAREELECT